MKKIKSFRKLIHPAYLSLMKKIENNDVIVVNPEILDYLDKEYFSKNIPVSFCANHTNSHDIPVAAIALQEHFYVMVALEGLTLEQKFALNLNGPIFLKRDSKKSRNKAFYKYVDLQKKGYNTLIYPEASWNITEEKLMNKFYTGVVDASKQTRVNIVPVVFEYIENKCYVMIGMPIDIDNNLDSRVIVDNIRDIMSTMRKDLLENNLEYFKLIKRVEEIADKKEHTKKDFDELYYIHSRLNELKVSAKDDFYKQIENNWNECPGLDKDFEDSCLYKDIDSPDEVFGPLLKMNKHKNNEFLFNPNLTGYTKKK